MSHVRHPGIYPDILYTTDTALVEGGGIKGWTFQLQDFVKFYWGLRVMVFHATWEQTDHLGQTFTFDVSANVTRDGIVAGDEHLLAFPGLDNTPGSWTFSGSGTAPDGGHDFGTAGAAPHIGSCALACTMNFRAATNGDSDHILWNPETNLIFVPFSFNLTTVTGPAAFVSGVYNHTADQGTLGVTSNENVLYDPSGNPTGFASTVYLDQDTTSPVAPTSEPFRNFTFQISFKDRYPYDDVWNTEYEDDTKLLGTTYFGPAM